MQRRDETNWSVESIDSRESSCVTRQRKYYSVHDLLGNYVLELNALSSQFILSSSEDAS